MSATQDHSEIAVGTPLGKDVLLLRAFRFQEEMGRPFRMTLDMLSENASISSEGLIGQNVTVRLASRKRQDPRYFNGIVNSLTRLHRVGRYMQYSATVVPWIWLLTRTSNCRIFQSMTLPQIIEKVFRDHGLTDFTNSVYGDHPSWDYCVQYRETDFDFVTRLMEREGLYYFFRHEDGKHTLVLADSTSAHQPLSGYAKLEVVRERNMRSVGEAEHVYEKLGTCQLLPGAFAHNDFDFESPKKNLLASSRITRRHAVSDFEMYDYPGDHVEKPAGEKVARLHIEELQAPHEVFSCRGHSRGVAVGHVFEMEEIGGPAGGPARHLATAVELSASVNEYESETGAPEAPSFECAFRTMDADQPFRLPRTTPRPRIAGPQTAIVVGKSGEEIWTDKYGRVKLKFHWDRYSKADENSSCWVRVANTWSGRKWGSIYIPRIGQEVIVEFLEGDPDRPIITGRVYNGDNMPPYDLPGDQTKSTLKSNSSKGGGGFNELRFEDKKGSEQVFLHAEMDEDVRVKNDSREWIGRDRHLIVKRDQIEKVEGDKHLAVKGNQNEKVGGTVSLQTGMALQQKVGTNHALQAGQEIHLKAGMNVVIEAGVSLTIKVGGSFVNLGPAGVAISGPIVQINSGGAAGAGSGASPEAPKEPKEADKADPGKVDEPPKPGQPGPQAKAMIQAAKVGAPYC